MRPDCQAFRLVSISAAVNNIVPSSLTTRAGTGGAFVNLAAQQAEDPERGDHETGDVRARQMDCQA